MSTFKKLLALSLALAMVLSFSVFAADYKDDTYKDAASIDEDCAEAVELMYALDIMKGDQNSNFNPTGSITRAEIAKMIYVVLNKGKDDQAVNFKYNQMFSDVSGDAWYAGYVNYCAATKLIDGFNGKFLPLQPVTTAQAAKMLLTAIGYSSENRNYTGSNWEKNVLADAAVVGLLENYNWPTNQTAPRQWIAVMFENMLLDAYTYGTARPGTINGLLTGTMGELGGQSIITMGKKYFGLVDYTGYLYGVQNAYIEEVTMVDEKTAEPANTGYSNRAVFGNASAKSGRTIRNVKLGYMDLGQQYRVIYSDSDFNGGYNYAYSVRPTGTSKVADAMLKDMESEINRKTSSNDAANRYIFTINDMEASFNSKSINALILNERPYLKDEDDPDADKLLKTMTPRTLDGIVGEYKTDDYRAVDKDGDGDIDYLIIKQYTYGQVTKVGNHRDYGEYFNAITPVKGNDAGTLDYKVTGYGANNITNWYLSDVVNSETAIEKDNAIKVCYNPDKDMYDVEVLPVSTGEYTKRTQNQLKAHTIGGEEYLAAKDGFENPYLELISKNLKEELTFAYDENLVVLVGQLSSNITDLDEINAQLVLVTDAYVDVYSSGKNRLFIDYMTIDGEMHEEIRYDNDEDYQEFYDLLDNGTYVGKSAEDQNGNLVADAVGDLENSREMLTKHQRLFKLVENDDETVSLIKLTPDDETAKENSKDVLNYADTLLSGYEEDLGTLNTKKDTFDHDDVNGFNAHGDETDFVNDENVFFVSYLNNKGRMVFDVMTMEELGEGTSAADASFIQGLYYTRRSTNTHLAGHIYVGALDLGQSTGYLYTTDRGAYELGKGDWYLDGVVFGNNANGIEAEEAIYVNSVWDADQDKYVAVKDENDIKPNCLYAYTYQKSSGTLEYDLRLIDELDPTQNTFVNDPKEYFRFDFTYDDAAGTFDPDDANRVVEAELSDIINRTQDVILKGADGTSFTLDDDAIIALKTVTLDRDETQEIGWGDDKTYGFEVSEKIEFVSFNELTEEEDGVSVNHIFDDDAEQNNDTYSYYSDVYYKLNDKGDCVALYVVVYEVMVEANWAY